MTATFTVVTADDTRDEDDETFTVTVSVKANEALAATTTAGGHDQGRRQDADGVHR